MNVLFYLFLVVSTFLNVHAYCPYETNTIFIITDAINIGYDKGEGLRDSDHQGPRSLIITGENAMGCVADIEVFETKERLNTGDIYVHSEELKKIRKTELKRKVDGTNGLKISDIIAQAGMMGPNLEQQTQPPEKECDNCEIEYQNIPIPQKRPADLGKARDSARPIGDMSISDKGINLIKEFEGYSAGFHKDGQRKVNGQWVNVPAIGHGYQVPTYEALKNFCREILKSPPGTPACKKAYREWKKIYDGATKSKPLINEKMADRALRLASSKKERHLRRHFSHLRLTQNEYDALASLMYNYPKGFYAKFETNLYAELKKRPPNMYKVARHMHDVGPFQGHYRRRLHEVNALLYGDYGYPSGSLAQKVRNSPQAIELYRTMRRTWKDQAEGKAFWEMSGFKKKYNSFIREVTR